MRVSAEPSDPGYANFDISKDYFIFLDGNEVEKGTCITADEEEGEVVLLLGFDTSAQEVRLETRKGKVRIEVRDPCLSL